jgi:hypothetical protein
MAGDANPSHDAGGHAAGNATQLSWLTATAFDIAQIVPLPFWQLNGDGVRHNRRPATFPAAALMTPANGPFVGVRAASKQSSPDPANQLHQKEPPPDALSLGSP